ncbi:MAG TPA: selenide, water dikinase SelD [Longimicrobiales bacterium]|nr:selenide, water dikinase SelD [Longimicrobiales bacterium]
MIEAAPRLTQLSHGGGCACKLGMAELAEVLKSVAPVGDPEALVGWASGDDAAVYRVSPDRAVVVTTDFFTPIVDDPYDFGRIAAANAISDLYAMGARPLFALNLVAFPRGLLGQGVLERIVRGGSDVAAQAGVPVLGGHSIDDPEPKYGMVAVGEVHPDRVVTNAGARAGDALVLTKPIGSGVITSALKAGAASAEAVAGAVEVMATLNAAAARAMRAAGAHAATDVTGFGLLGHLHRMLTASSASARLDAEAVPFLAGARELARAGHVSGGTRRNLKDLASHVTFADSVDDVARTLLADAQTSGGLLIAVAAERAPDLLAELGRRAPAAAVIGRVEEGAPGTVRVA